MKNTFLAMIILSAPAALYAMEQQMAVESPSTSAKQKIDAAVARIRAVGTLEGTDPKLFRALDALENDPKAQEQAVKLLTFLRNNFQAPVAENRVTAKEEWDYKAFLREFVREYNVDFGNVLIAIVLITFFNEGFDDVFLNWYAVEKQKTQDKNFFNKVDFIASLFDNARTYMIAWNPSKALDPNGYVAKAGLNKNAALTALKKTIDKDRVEFQKTLKAK